MALSWGVGGAVGTFAGRWLSGRADREPENKQLKMMALAAAICVPVNVAMLLAPARQVAMGCLFLGAIVNALATAPTFSMIQALVPEAMRATAVASIFLCANLIGLGLGPLAVGFLSDSLAPEYGDGALRVALLACTPGYWWVAAHYLVASRTVTADLRAIEGIEHLARQRLVLPTDRDPPVPTGDHRVRLEENALPKEASANVGAGVLERRSP
jgi:MFS family permease